MNIEEFKAAVARDEELLARGVALPGMDTCVSCKTPIQSFLTGREHLGDGSVVCNDCYFELLGAEVEQHPLGGRLRRSRSLTGAKSEAQQVDQS
jgi:hypothetical protein